MARKKVNKLHKDRQQEKRALFGFLFTVAASLSVLAIIVWGVMEFRSTETLPIKNVEVKGEFIRITEQQIQNIVAGNDLGGFFDTDVGAITKSMRQLPWLNSVTVRRVWPDTIQLEIRERKAIAYWNKTALLSVNGTVFKPDVASYPTGLPALSGPDNTQRQVLENYILLNAELQKIHLNIHSLALDDRRAWSLHLDDGTLLDLGRKDITQRMNRFISVYNDYIENQKNNIEVVDLRYTNGFAVRWKNKLKKTPVKAQLG